LSNIEYLKEVNQSQAEPRIDENEEAGVLQEIHSHYQTYTREKM